MGNPAITAADMSQPTVVKRSGTALAATDEFATEDLRPSQIEFLKKRAELKTQFEEETEGTYKSADEVSDKKSIYITIVVGLIVVAFVAPMIQFFYFTGGE